MRAALIVLLLLCFASSAFAQESPDTSRGDKLLAEYFARETRRLEEQCLAEIETLDDWNVQKAEYRRQLFDMLGHASIIIAAAAKDSSAFAKRYAVAC